MMQAVWLYEPDGLHPTTYCASCTSVHSPSAPALKRWTC
jgi:hypothetical protein